MTPEQREARKKVLAGDLDFVTGQISTLVRQMTFGVLALVWALLLKDKDLSAIDWSPRFLLVLAGLAVLTMTMDFLQYMAGYAATRRAYGEVELGREGKFQPGWLSYRLRGWCFMAKIVLCMLLVALFLGRVVLFAWGWPI